MKPLALIRFGSREKRKRRDIQDDDQVGAARIVSKLSVSRVLNDVHLGRDGHCDGWDDSSQ